MYSLNIMNIALELWGIIITYAILLLTLSIKSLSKNKKMRKALLLNSIAILLTDLVVSVSIEYGGLLFSVATGIIISKIFTFITYATSYIHISLVAFYYLSLFKKRENKDNVCVIIINVIIAILLILLVENIFSGHVYYFLVDGEYQTGALFAVNYACVLCAIAALMVMVVLNRKQFSASIFIANITYFVVVGTGAILGIMSKDVSILSILSVAVTDIIVFLDVIFYYENIENKVEDLQSMQFDSEHDAMTGLYNKKEWLNLCQTYVEQMPPYEKAVIAFIDIDNFKSVNDKFGHAEGDLWIITVARALQECFPHSVLGRFGGDEFLVLKKNISGEAEIRECVDRFHEAMELKRKQLKHDVYCSGGLGMISGSNYDVTSCLETVDKLLYEGKKKNSGTCLFVYLKPNGKCDEIMDLTNSTKGRRSRQNTDNLLNCDLIFELSVQTANLRMIYSKDGISSKAISFSYDNLSKFLCEKYSVDLDFDLLGGQLDYGQLLKTMNGGESDNYSFYIESDYDYCITCSKLLTNAKGEMENALISVKRLMPRINPLHHAGGG